MLHCHRRNDLWTKALDQVLYLQITKDRKRSKRAYTPIDCRHHLLLTVHSKSLKTLISVRMSDSGTPRDERFATPRLTGRSMSSTSDSKSDADIWQTPRAAVGAVGRKSSLSDYEFETPRAGDDYQALHSARSTGSNREINQYMQSEEKSNQSRGAAKQFSDDKSYHQKYESSSRLSVHDEVEEDQLGVIEGILEEDIESVFRHARHGRADDMEILFARGMPVNIRDEFGSTLLIIACQNGNKKIAKLVLRRGGAINAQNAKGNTSLHYCYQCKS
jgi:Ankyrin repeats (many copies)